MMLNRAAMLWGSLMDLLIVGIAAFLASGLTLYSGFGLGTVLLPAFALFFPAPAAVAATGAVHLLNNLFKGGLLGRDACWPVVLRFGLPAIPAAIFGAWLLAQLGRSEAIYEWHALGGALRPSGAGIAIGSLMIVFALLELQPWFQRLAVPRCLMPVGGLLTGFLGGLSGQQGALRSMFLVKSGLDPKPYISTGVMIAILVDLSRLPVYAASLDSIAIAGQRELMLIAVGTLCAFLGAWLGARYVRKVTIDAVRILVAGLILMTGASLALGLIGA